MSAPIHDRTATVVSTTTKAMVLYRIHCQYRRADQPLDGVVIGWHGDRGRRPAVSCSAVAFRALFEVGIDIAGQEFRSFGSGDV